MANRRPTDRIGRAGEHYVAAELNRRGAYASPFSGNVPGIDIVATDAERKHMAYIQVKTKRELGKNWQLGNGLAQGWKVPVGASCVSLGGCKEAPECMERKPQHKHAEGFPHADAVDVLTLPIIEGRPDHFWVFVSLEGLKYWIVPDTVFRKHLIREGAKAYLKEHGGHRPGRVHESLHSAMNEQILADRLCKWDKLGLGLD